MFLHRTQDVDHQYAIMTNKCTIFKLCPKSEEATKTLVAEIGRFAHIFSLISSLVVISLTLVVVMHSAFEEYANNALIKIFINKKLIYPW